MVTAFFERLGNAGILLIAVALLAGGLAGAAITHHYEQTSNSVASDQQKHKGPGAQKPPNNKGQGKQKHSNKPPQTRTPQAPEQPETD